MTDLQAQDDLDTLFQLMAERPLLVLTGAGISTASGIPDYRDGDGVRRGRAPMMVQEFLGSPTARRRYWARSMLGWPRILLAQPNAAHEALAGLQAQGLIAGVITQNVDALHSQAGSQGVMELHGNLHRVLCLDCQQRMDRERIQVLMERANPYLAGVDAVQAPDGDTLLDEAFEVRFEIPRCPYCDGERLKPDVVFFGENVLPATAASAAEAVARAEGLLVVGSSLMAYSAFRLCRAMVDRHKPLVAINFGKTRADDLLTLKLEAPCERLLPLLAQRLAALSS